MDSISVNGEKYVKAGSIAKELGYTADYVGQLARAKKIKAALIGRTWYVKESSIRSHKTTRYRSVVTKSKQEIKKVLTEEATNTSANASIRINNPAGHSYLKNSYHPTVKYESDEEDLIPILKEVDPRSLPGKSKDLEVELADAEKVKVRSLGSSYRVEATPRPELTFRGRLTISDAEEPVPEEKPQRSGTIKIEKLKVTELDRKTSKVHLDKEESKGAKPRRSKGHHVSVIEEGPAIEPVAINANNTVVNRPRKWLRRFIKLTLFILAISAIVVASMIEIKTVIVGDRVNQLYLIEPEAFINLYNTLKNIVISAIRDVVG